MKQKELQRVKLMQSGREGQFKYMVHVELIRTGKRIEDVESLFKKRKDYIHIKEAMENKRSSFSLKYLESAINALGSNVILEIDIIEKQSQRGIIGGKDICKHKFIASDTTKAKDYRKIIEFEMKRRKVIIEDFSDYFRSNFEYYNFRDFMKGEKDVCSFNFFEKIMKLLKCDVETTIVIETK